MVLAKEALDRCFRERKDLYIGIDLFVYYEKGNNKAWLAPDVFVAFDVETGERDTYKVWEEGKAPDFVLEVRSASTEWRDRDVKPEIYARMGVSEYWRLSPRVHHLESSLEGYRLQGGRYQQLERVELEEAGEWYWSEALGLHLRAKWSEDVTVAAFRDPATGQEVLTGADVDWALVKENGPSWRHKPGLDRPMNGPDRKRSYGSSPMNGCGALKSVLPPNWSGSTRKRMPRLSDQLGYVYPRD